MAALLDVLLEGQQAGKVVAVGEMGLDYDRCSCAEQWALVVFTGGRCHCRRRGKIAFASCLLHFRLQFCPAETQRKWFARQFDLARDSGLPVRLICLDVCLLAQQVLLAVVMITATPKTIDIHTCNRPSLLVWSQVFLHMRAAAEDLLAIVRQKSEHFTRGVVHSFDGTLEEAHSVLSIPSLSIGEYCFPACSRPLLSATQVADWFDCGLSCHQKDGQIMRAGINGCSLKTEENLQVVAQLPLERLLLETGVPQSVAWFYNRLHAMTVVPKLDE